MSHTAVCILHQSHNHRGASRMGLVCSHGGKWLLQQDDIRPEQSSKTQRAGHRTSLHSNWQPASTDPIAERQNTRPICHQTVYFSMNISSPLTQVADLWLQYAPTATQSHRNNMSVIHLLDWMCYNSMKLNKTVCGACQSFRKSHHTHTLTVCPYIQKKTDSTWTGRPLCTKHITVCPLYAFDKSMSWPFHPNSLNKNSRQFKHSKEDIARHWETAAWRAR